MPTKAARPSASTAPQSIDPADSAGPLIDWASEAEKVAATPSPEFQPFDGPPPAESNPSTRSIFEDRPAHHAGEQIRTDDGRWVVYVSDYCYQMTNPFAAPNALETGVGMQTYCLRKSNQPRGDLFDELAAYDKYHGSR
jgi:hypothetical protein